MRKINWRYAFGELLIVTIGISLAFGLNNWNENRKQNNLAREYLVNLHEELKRDVDTLTKSLYRMEKTKAYIYGYINAVYQPHLRHDSISSKIYRLGEIEIFAENQATFTTLINSGDIALITNLDLRTAIVEQYNIYKDLHLKEEIYSNYMADYMGPFMIRNYSYARRMQTDLDPWETDELINLVFSAYGILQ
jgi:hypothetical protein